jgi:Tol biopolymer transport system component
VRLAPDGSRAALDAVQKNGLAVFLADVQTGVTTLLEQGEDPIWSPDGREVLFRRSGKGLFRRTVGEPGPAELVLGEAENCVPVSWVDGAGGPTIVRLVRDSSGSQHYDMEQLSWDGTESSVRPLRATPNEESFPEISPDGRWLAYVSDESGQREVYLQSFPEETSRRQVSTDGGTDPAWSADGRELFYITPKRDSQGRANMMSVRLLDSAPLRLATPVVLFDYDTRELALGCFLRRCHDVAPDGQGFYVAARVGAAVEAPDITHINLVVNWAKELKARVPVGK